MMQRGNAFCRVGESRCLRAPRGVGPQPGRTGAAALECDQRRRARRGLPSARRPFMQETSDPGALAHRAAVEAERADRNARLRDPLGWLTLVGLHWLHPGMQSFGAGADNEIVLGSETRGVPAVAG